MSDYLQEKFDEKWKELDRIDKLRSNIFSVEREVEITNTLGFFFLGVLATFVIRVTVGGMAGFILSYICFISTFAFAFFFLMMAFREMKKDKLFFVEDKHLEGKR